MIWIIGSIAVASGIILPDVRVVDARCATVSTDAPVSASAPLYLAGVIRGSTSAPGGPVSHHTFPLEAEHLSVVREGCRTPEPGRFSVVGACGEGVMVRFRGDLEPGVTYQVGAQDSWGIRITTDGTAARGGCPEDPLAFGIRDEKTWGEARTQTLQIPRDLFTVDADHHTFSFPKEHIAEQLGMAPLDGPVGFWIERAPALPETVEMQVTLRPYRHRYESEGEGGAVRCIESDAVLIELAVPALDMKASVGWEDPERVSDKKGYCR